MAFRSQWYTIYIYYAHNQLANKIELRNFMNQVPQVQPVMKPQTTLRIIGIGNVNLIQGI